YRPRQDRPAILVQQGHAQGAFAAQVVGGDLHLPVLDRNVELQRPFRPRGSKADLPVSVARQGALRLKIAPPRAIQIDLNDGVGGCIIDLQADGERKILARAYEIGRLEAQGRRVLPKKETLVVLGAECRAVDEGTFVTVHAQVEVN